MACCSNCIVSETAVADENVEIWKTKKLIRSLDAVRGSGTSMISLMIPPKHPISRTAKLLTEELGTASNIKSRVNQKSVVSAILSVQQRLKLYSRVPPNGLVIFCGTITTDEGKEKMINIDFEPLKLIVAPMYHCDNRFHTDVLGKMLKTDSRFGFIVVDGNGALFGVLCGNAREVIHKFNVQLPKKHGRGGQSALRFARLRLEKRHNYIMKVAETALAVFTTQGQVNVEGLILAGSADIKTELSNSEMLDSRLRNKIMKLVDISYGGIAGFNQAIHLASDVLSDVKFVRERKIIESYFEHISRDTGKYCFGVDDTLKALELGAIDTLIVWENLSVKRYVMRDNLEEKDVVVCLTPEQEHHPYNKDSTKVLEITESELLLDWLAKTYKTFGATLEIVSEKSQEGSQFCKGFGGMGGILRYKVDFESINGSDMLDEEEFDVNEY